jgi:mannose-6-phosphate isomerase-like protein (cupin superfamily)
MEEESREAVELTGATVRFVPVEPGAPYAMIEWDVEVGAPSPPVHVHHHTDEGFYVMAGKFAFLLDGARTYATPGAHVMVPRGHPHTFWNAGPTPARCLCVVLPPGFEAYFRELGPLLADSNSADSAIEARRTLSAKYDIEIVGPPVDTAAEDP